MVRDVELHYLRGLEPSHPGAEVMFRWLWSWLRWLWGETPPRPRPPQRRGLSGFESLEDRNVPTVLPAGLLDLPVAAGMTNPTSMEFSPDGRIFVAEKAGRLRVV